LRAIVTESEVLRADLVNASSNTLVLSADVRGPIISLLSMLQFYANLFVKNLNEITAAQALFRAAQATSHPSADDYSLLYAQVAAIAIDCKMYGLKSALDKCASIREQLERRKLAVTCGDIHHWLADLRERLESDLSREYFLELSQKEAELYKSPAGPDWRDAIWRFRRIKYNVEEANKCFALGRYGAAVFHILLVAEFGVIEVAKLFGVEGDKPGWGSLERLEKINKTHPKERSLIELEHAEFLKNVIPLASAIKDSWRHKISHVDNQLEWVDTDFSPQVASEIISATCGFMRRLAADLPRPTKSAAEQEPSFPGVS